MPVVRCPWFCTCEATLEHERDLHHEPELEYEPGPEPASRHELHRASANRFLVDKPLSALAGARSVYN